MQLGRFKNRTPARFEYIYCTLFPLCHSNQDMYPFLKEASFCLCFCFVHTIAQFSRVLRYSHIYCQIFRIVPFVDGSRYKIYGPVTTTEFRMHCFNDRVREVPKISPDIILGRYFEIMTRLGTISKTSLGFNNRYLLVVVNG